MKEYTTIQMEKELYVELRDYCKKNGYTVSGLIERLTRNHITNVPNGKRVLRVKTSHESDPQLS
jgi:predicted DNA-binding ribbon-helix-helix protein